MLPKKSKGLRKRTAMAMCACRLRRREGEREMREMREKGTKEYCGKTGERNVSKRPRWDALDVLYATMHSEMADLGRMASKFFGKCSSL